jgi:endonuclease/exonuclease/phosphatase (EEP) superfamily protein YafD
MRVQQVRIFAALTVALAVAGCATQTRTSEWAAAGMSMSPESCSAQLGSNRLAPLYELDSRDIRILNWNIQKGGNPDWIADLSAIGDEPDLLILQEATLQADTWTTVGADHFRSFAAGYRTIGRAGSVTGVLTMSDAEPLTSCSLVSYEPWLRSPKATMITEYGLTNSDQSLVVVNIHAINFTITNRDFREQVRRALSVIRDHEGPVLLSGDFNTWHWRQSRILQQMADDHGLRTLSYEKDYRKRVFGQPLDHIYIRGLRVINATSFPVNSSDHNPMSVRLSL